MSAAEGSARAQPFFCPYCGEQDIRPAAAAAGTWYCHTCDRRWVLAFEGSGESSKDE